VLVAVLVTGCSTSDSLSPTIARTPITAPAHSAAAGRPLLFDDEMNALALQHPGFAGLVAQKDGSLRVLATARADQPSLEQGVKSFALSHGMSAAATISFGSAQHDFATLFSARQNVRHVRMPGLRFIDIDEASNRVVVAVATAADSIATAAALAKGVDSAQVVNVIVVPPVKTMTDLTDFSRPIIAGLQIVMENGGTCTAGPIARPSSGSTRYMIVNSHCTATPWANDGGAAHQPFIWNLWGTHFGTESLDVTPWWDDGVCGEQYYYCRYSDAARVTLDSTTSHSIARTTWVSVTPGSAGSTTLATGGNFSVTGVVPYSNLVLGQGLHKVGRTTGWTAGEITRTCVDVAVVANPNNFLLLCQFAASGAVGAGDSGSPVFQWYGGAPSYNSYLAGILWGAYSSSEFAFSPWYNITLDLGTLYPNP
jgi:hypothetical protein